MRGSTGRSIATESTHKSTPLHSQTLTLPDGRTLGFAEYGCPSGTPLFYFHGLPSSRVECADWDDLGKKLNARIFGVDRPGMGLSTFQPNRKILDWPSDFRHLTNHLGLTEYRAVGSSGGTPYILACARTIPKDELRGVGILAGIGPWELGTAGMRWLGRLMFNLLCLSPDLVGRLTARSFVKAAQDRDPEVSLKQFEEAMKWMREKERAIFENNELLRKQVADAFKQAFIQGADGYVHEVKLVTNHWGFELQDIVDHKVQFWYGDEDENTPISHGRQMAQRIPNAALKEYPGETHFTLSTNHAGSFLKEFLDSD